MDALTALHSRNSINILTNPGPTKIQLSNIIQAGLRACDHGQLRPWKYLVIEGDARLSFGRLMAKAQSKIDGTELSDAAIKKFQGKAFRAPMIIAIVAKITEHPKIPKIEQLLSAGASAQMMMTAAHAQDIGAIWRSGALMFEQVMHEGLNLEKSEELVGFIYLGTAKAAKPLPELSTDNFIEYWNGN